MAYGSAEVMEELYKRVAQLEQRLASVESFLNKAFNTSTQQGLQYAQPNDRNETGMGAIVGADRTTFI